MTQVDSRVKLCHIGVMKLADISQGDVLVSTDENGSGYYRVEKVCQTMIKVRTEQGHTIRAYPATFDRKINYPVAAFAGLKEQFHD